MSPAPSSETGVKLNASKRGQWGWALFDWANQPFYTVVTTFIFVPYLTSQVFQDQTQATVWMGMAHTIIGISVACLAILLGPIADYTGHRKWWIFTFSLLCVAGSWGLYWAVPGADASTLVFVLTAFVIATIGLEVAIMFNHSMLPTLVSDHKMGQLSGNAWALGYTGGMIVLICVLVFFTGYTGEPLIPLDQEMGEPSRITGPIAAIWLLVFMLPMMLWTPDVRNTGYTIAQASRKGLGDLVRTFKHVGHYRNMFRFLLARMLYGDGINAIIAFSGIYVAATLDWGIMQMGVFGIILNVFATWGSMWGGYMDDKKSSKFVIYVAVSGLAIGALGILSITKTSVLFFISVPLEGNGYAPLFDSPAEQVLLVFAIIMGFCLGPAQAASRTLMARLTPAGHEAQFFGLYALTGKATAWLAPLLIAVVAALADNQRLGISVTLVFLLVGLVLLWGVKEDRTHDPDHVPHDRNSDFSSNILSKRS